MKNAALAIVVVLLFANTVMYSFWVEEEEGGIWDHDDDDDVVTPIDALTLSVPGVRGGDILHYDYNFLAEMYEKNRTSGGWWRLTLEANGQLIEQVGGKQTRRDGFGQPHDSWSLHTDLTLSVTISVTSFDPEESNEPLIIKGKIEGGRDRFATLRGDVPIENYAGGLLSVEGVEGLNLALDTFKFNVDNWAYPDPNVEPERSLEERLYGEGATIMEGMNGSYGEPFAGSNYTQWYNWSMDASERIRGYDCLRLNISMDFFGFLGLEKLIWLSDDVPRPVRIMYNSTTRWFEQNSTGHLILVTDQRMIRDGYTRGGNPVPIDYDAKETFINRHPYARCMDWEFGPSDGSLEGSSFDFGLEEALDHALTNSDELNDWLRTHPSPVLNGAEYHANQTDPLTVEYTWNISLADERGDWQTWEDWGPTNAFAINVTKRVETRIREDIVTTFIEPDPGPVPGYSVVEEKHIQDQLVTLASSELIWASESRISNRAYSGIEQDVDFEEAAYYWIMGGVNPAGFGVDLLDTLTGISVPTSNLTWALHMGGVDQSTTAYWVGVDAETGRLIFVTDVEGPQSLEYIFSTLD